MNIDESDRIKSELLTIVDTALLFKLFDKDEDLKQKANTAMNDWKAHIQSIIKEKRKNWIN